MKKSLFVLLAAAFACACQSSKVRISGRFVGSDARTVYLEEVTPYVQTLIDSVTLDADGAYRFEVRGADATPTLYNILYNGERIPLLVAGGDRLTVGALGSVVRNYTVEGSEESELLRQFYQPYVAGVRELDGYIASYGRTEPDSERRTEYMRRYADRYRDLKREQLRFIVGHKGNLAAVYALYQRIPGDPYLFNPQNDVIYFRTVAEAIAESYPASPYVAALQGEIERMEARLNLTVKVNELGYPDIELPDMYGKKIRLSSLKDKVILLDFWSAELGNSNALNAELKRTYEKYAPRGFEVYQVAVDVSKPLWITSVQEQALPWISVSDLKGRLSPVYRTYNVGRLPANFLIDRAGEIAGKDLYGPELEQKLDELIR